VEWWGAGMERQRSPPREGTRPATVPVWPSLLHVAPSGGIPSNEVTPGTLLIRPLFAPCFFLFSVLSICGVLLCPRKSWKLTNWGSTSGRNVRKSLVLNGCKNPSDLTTFLTATLEVP